MRPRSATWLLAGCGSRATEEPADDRLSSVRDVDGRVRVAAHGVEIPPLVADAPPLAVGSDEPRALLAADFLREARQRFRVSRFRTADDEIAATTMPVTAWAGVAGRRKLAVGTPLDRGDSAEVQVPPAEADDVLPLELDSGLDVDDAAVQMQTRRIDGVFDSHATTYYVRHDLQDRAAQTL